MLHGRYSKEVSMARLIALFAPALAALELAGCNSSPVSAPPPAPAIPAVAQPQPVSGILAGPLGAKLDEADRRRAFDAQLLSLESGQRRTWKGARGAYGFIEPGAEAARSEGACRSYSHKIYLAGRPQAGEGLACRIPGGGWKVLS